MVRLLGEAAESTFTDSEKTQTYINRDRQTAVAGKCLFTYIKKVQWCHAVCLCAVEQDPFSTVLANQAGVLLHLRLVAGAFAFAGVGCIGHDGPSV